jgi:hypothetical protein
MLHALDALVVAPDRKCAAEEEREDSAPQELILAERPARAEELVAPIRRERGPVEAEVDSGNVHSPSTSQTVMSQPSPRRQNDLASSSGNCSWISRRASASPTVTSAAHSATGRSPLRRPAVP